MKTLEQCDPTRHLGPPLDARPRMVDGRVVIDSFCEACGERFMETSYREDAWRALQNESGTGEPVGGPSDSAHAVAGAEIVTTGDCATSVDSICGSSGSEESGGIS